MAKRRPLVPAERAQRETRRRNTLEALLDLEEGRGPLADRAAELKARLKELDAIIEDHRRVIVECSTELELGVLDDGQATLPGVEPAPSPGARGGRRGRRTLELAGDPAEESE